MFSWKDCHISYINLAHRIDRRQHMEAELARVGLEAERFEAIKTSDYQWDEKKYGVMLRRTPGAVGCWRSQVLVMEHGWQKWKSTIVLEDDLIFATDIKERLDYIERFINEKEPDFDIFFLGGTVHINPAFWHTGNNPDLLDCRCEIKRDAERTDDPRIIRTLGMFSTHSYIVNEKSIRKILGLLDGIVHEAMGIDWALIKLQPQLKCFAFMPGSVIQKDNASDIGGGITYFSGFAKLGAHWFSDNINDFNPDTYNWAEVTKK